MFTPEQLFGTSRALIGMVHVGALPGTPGSRRGIGELAERAAREARTLARAGFDAVMIENMHDAPYVLPPHGPEITAAMTACALAVRDAIGDRPLGVQILACGHREALGVALASGAAFIRCENFVFAHVADEGLMPTAQAGPLLRYRKSIGAEKIAILTDLAKKHASHAITADLDIEQLARGAEFFGSDGLIITGRVTGERPVLEDLRLARQSSALPVLVGSGADAGNLAELFEHADAVIVGSSIKRGGSWRGDVDPTRAAALVKAARAVRRTR